MIKATSKEEAAQKVSEIFSKMGYALEEGDSFKGAYGKGNKMMRMLFGAFVERFVFNFEVLVDVDKFFVQITKHSVSSISGGMLGASKYNKEFTKVQEFFATELK